MADRKIDWPTIELEFVQGVIEEGNERYWPSRQELSQKYAISKNYLYCYAREHKWADKKRLYIDKIAIEDPNALSANVGNNIDDFDRNTFQAAANILAYLTRKAKNFINDRENKLDELNKILKLMERTQQIAKLASSTSKEDLQKSKGEFTKLMNKLKEDESKAYGMTIEELPG